MAVPKRSRQGVFLTRCMFAIAVTLSGCDLLSKKLDFPTAKGAFSELRCVFRRQSGSEIRWYGVGPGRLPSNRPGNHG